MLALFCVASAASGEGSERQNCLCACLAPPGGQFSCSYDTEDAGWSPSCKELSNGPCICKAYGCFRGQIPTEGECVDKCYEKHPKSMSEKAGGIKEAVKGALGKLKGGGEDRAGEGGTAASEAAATTNPTTTTYPFFVKGGRPYHSRIGVAEPPPTEDCPGGEWMLLDTQWQTIGYKKTYVLEGWENYTRPGPRPGFIGFFKDIGGLVSDLWNGFWGKTTDGRYEDSACDYIADHTFQCSTKLELVRNIEQRETVDHEPCYTKA
ncbi:MAG: hypothetical protein GF416_06685 [Candidatus Altiarchaeales archaeon]|nr:hypothetical protein [Candidatus Altiarchaeales archaeon]MBD3416799.1 hypothetical protein [Candidatus Altiarchaeales archaeon]